MVSGKTPVIGVSEGTGKGVNDTGAIGIVMMPVDDTELVLVALSVEDAERSAECEAACRLTGITMAGIQAANMNTKAARNRKMIRLRRDVWRNLGVKGR